MKVYFIKGNLNNESYSKYFKQYITGGYYWINIKGKLKYRIIVIKQNTLFYTYRILLHEYLHYIFKNNIVINNFIEKYI